MFSFQQFHQQVVEQLQKDIDYLFATVDLPDTLKQASYYAMTGAGKKVRPLLVATSFASVYYHNNPQKDKLQLPISVRRAMLAVELIHVYSLVHDDLPCMDDDELRRGRATCHIKFDEGTALLVGDVLQSLAFEVLSTSLLDDSDNLCLNPIELVTSTRLVSVLAPQARRMVSGQMRDVEGENKQLTYEQLKAIHVDKTGALIEASVLMGAICAKATQLQLASLTKVAKKLGLAFQVQDDILDVTANTQQLGKVAGSDEKLDKSTYVKLMGVEQAKQYAHDLFEQASQALAQFGDNNQLMQLANWLWRREK
ncbi:MAG: polyprenyl synthetase family protein [Moraxellaceae bacterium]|nr:polyprenyl synthetase family protein [Moraxellaceae bacterium]